VRVEAVGGHLGADTDFTAKLVEVHADRAINLCDGIVRAGVRARRWPQAAYRFTIELWEISA
jgi:predicted acyl esterase